MTAPHLQPVHLDDVAPMLTVQARVAHEAATRDTEATAFGVLVVAYLTAEDLLADGKPAGYVISKLWTAHARARRLLGLPRYEGGDLS